MSEAGFTHIVAQGDCIGSISDRNGHFWQTLWDAPKNASLKSLRQDPNVLEPGDQVYVPALLIESQDGATEARHRFRKKGVPAKLRLRLLVRGKPRANIRYVAIIDGALLEGSTDDDGRVELNIPPQAREGTLRLHTDSGVEEYVLSLGGLDPLETIAGVQQRLRNMGIPCDVTGQEDEQTAAAVRVFQQRLGLEGDGQLNDDVRSKIKASHGS